MRLKVDGAETVSEKIADPAEAEQVKAGCVGMPAVCTSVTREQKKEQPPKLYDLTTYAAGGEPAFRLHGETDP